MATQSTLKKDGEQQVVPADRQKQIMRALKLHIFQACVQHVVTLQTEPMLMREVCGGDLAKASRMLGATSSIAAVLGLVVNQTGGKISDAVGRKPFTLIGPAVNLLMGTVLFLKPDNKAFLILCRILRLILTTFSGTVMVTASLADTFNPKEFGVALSQIQATVGIAIVFGPILEAQILMRTRQNLRYPYLALASLAGLHLVTSSCLLHETLDVARRKTLNFSEIISNVNPFSFMKIFSGSNSNFKRIVGISALQQFLEGKNLSDLGQMYMRNQLKWDVGSITKFVVAWGFGAVLSGAAIVPTLLKALGVQRFTTVANACMATSTCLQALSSTGSVYALAALIALPGLNGSSANGLRGLSNKFAEEAGIGGGDFSAMFNNLRAVVGALATTLLGFSYAFCRDRGLHGGLAYLLAGLIGAVIPQILLQSLESKSLSPAVADKVKEM